MKDEAKEWITKVYGKEFIVEGKGKYKMSVKAVSREDEKYKCDICDHIADRIKEVQIKSDEESVDNRSYSDVVKGILKKKVNWWDENETKEVKDDEIETTSYKSMRSNDSSITDTSKDSTQTTVILEMQETIKKMERDQQIMINHIKLMEDTVISLATPDEKRDEVSYESAKKTAEKVRKKRKIEEGEAKKKEKAEKRSVEVRRSERLNKATKQKQEGLQGIEHENEQETIQKDKQNRQDMELEVIDNEELS